MPACRLDAGFAREAGNAAAVTAVREAAAASLAGMGAALSAAAGAQAQRAAKLGAALEGQARQSGADLAALQVGTQSAAPSCVHTCSVLASRNSQIAA